MRHAGPADCFFSLYGKAFTLLFALFCVASGQVIPAAAGNGSPHGTAKSRALFASDSTPLSSLKLYLASVVIPKYGMGAVPEIHKIDSTVSDTGGYFEISGTFASWNYIVAEIIQAPAGSKPVTYISSNPYSPGSGDTVYTVYMAPLVPPTTGVGIPSGATATRPLCAIRGKTVTVRIPEWTNGIHGASVANVQGAIIARLRAQPNGDIRWNAESVAAGIYFLDITNGKNHLTVKIAIR